MSNQVWYWRHRGKVQGPYPSGLISRYILLGRIRPDDQLSNDEKNSWNRAGSFPELVPDIMKQKDPMAQERLKLARRWADERGVSREEGGDYIPHTAENQTHLPIKKVGMMGFVFSLVLFGALIYGAFQLMPETELAIPDCSAGPQDGVNWDNCRFYAGVVKGANIRNASMKNSVFVGSDFTSSNLSESDLSYADFSKSKLDYVNLSEANLTGATLKSTSLVEANFSHADLSYADLTGAIAKRMNIEGAKLDKTIWFDGSVCAMGSVGQCVQAQ